MILRNPPQEFQPAWIARMRERQEMVGRRRMAVMELDQINRMNEMRGRQHRDWQARVNSAFAV